ncbi:DUF4913 domain-containing protein [Sphaerisporangium viridialbum]|uniref:DUF4913 domain-containing protein n=1 Tax=Sphaerisporangium viridialbum TaxID=46189 RepID=UPI003C707491
MTTDIFEPEPALADLGARLTRLEAALGRQAEELDELRELAAADTEPADDHATGQDPAAEPGPTFLLLLDDEQLLAELPLLAMWVHEILVPYYVIEPTPGLPWCPQWWEHPEALARLHALWLAWQELTDPAAGGFTGASIWHRDHLDPALAVLRAPDGPLAGCTTDPRRPQHRQPPDTPIQPYPAVGKH